MMGDAGHVFIRKLRALMVDAKQAAMLSDAPTCRVVSGSSRCQETLHRFVHLAQRDLRMACDGLQPENHRRATAG